MLKIDSISFREFYINEFFDQVREKTRPDYKEENYKLIDELFTLLSSQDEITDGISKLAEEHASSELSIFLFDIFDRAQDYPPSELVDALPEIAEDFVSGLTIMLEEEMEIMTSIDKVIKDLRGEGIPETKPGEKESEQEFSKEDESIEKEIPEETHTFQEYVELSFFEQLHTVLQIQQNEEDTNTKIEFIRILLKTMNKSAKSRSHKSLGSLTSHLSKILPWYTGDTYKPSDIISNLSPMIDAIVTALYDIDDTVINDSVKEGSITIKEIEGVDVEEKKFKQEEIPSEPTTIDSLLSEYFQIEADEHIQKLKKTLKKLQKSPDDEKSLKELLESFQSFKEISMIHGYVILEDFCSEIIALINQSKKEKKEFNINTKSQLDSFLSILKNTDRLKDAREKTPESKELNMLLEYFRNNLFVPSESVKVESVLEEPARESKKNEKTIDAGNQEELTKILRSLLRDLKPQFKKVLTESSSDLNEILSLLNRLHNAVDIIGNQELIQFFDNYIKCVKYCQTIPVDENGAITSKLLTLYNSFTRKAKPDFKYEIYKDRIDKLMSSSSSSNEVSIDDKETLLKIIMENEGLNLQNFYSDLEKFFISKDKSIGEIQTNHFQGLLCNFNLIKCEELGKFPEMFLTIFRSKDLTKADKKVLKSIKNCYGDVVKMISEEGPGANVEEKLSGLKSALFQDEESIDDSEERTSKDDRDNISGEITEIDEPQTTDEEVEIGDSGEEDLDEIFKQESGKYIGIINSAMQELKNNPQDLTPYEPIEKSLHSLKSSARLMGYNDVADLSAPLEKMIEKLHAAEQSLSSDNLFITDKAVRGLESGMRKEEIDIEGLIEELKHIKTVDIITKTDSAFSSASVDEEVTEEQLFADSNEEDEDLLEIFKDESREYIAIVEKANQSLRNNLSDSDALSQLEHAMHSMKTAAKMLGFSEIGQIADSVEIVAVAILRGEIKNNSNIIGGFSKAIDLIKELTKGLKQKSENIDKISSELSLYRLKEIESSQPSSADSGKIEVRSPELDEQTQMFVKEGWELLEKLNRDLLRMEKNPGDTAIFADLNRTIHTLKGSAQILDFKQIGTLTHKIEDLFAKSKGGLNENELDIVFKSVDVMQDLIKSIKSGKGEKSKDISAVIEQVEAILNGTVSEKTENETGGSVIPPMTRPKLVGIENAEDEMDKSEQFIKITTDNLDNLVNMAAELVINKTQLNSYLDKLRRIGETIEDDKKRLSRTDRTITAFMEKNKDGENQSPESIKIDDNVLNDLLSVTNDFKDVISTFDTVSSSFRSITRDFEQNIGQISSLSKSLHDNILQIRLVPTEMLFNRFPRAVRDMAKKLKKKVNLVVEGEQTEMDRALIESLTDPVMHLVRNAIDHGIELPKERKEQGKSEDGIILLKAKRSKNQIIIEVQDDGHGIDPAVVKKEVLNKGLAGADDLEKMNTSEIMEYVFQPGFSTRDEASDVSGRGVGLDVVANQIKKLKGDIRINSTLGKGSIFIIRVPLTLAIAQAIMVKAGEEILAVPLSTVEETVQFQDPELVEKDERAFITVRDKLIPVAYLSSLLNFGISDKVKEETTKTAIIVREAGAMYALIVDGVLGREEIVIKSLGEELSKIPYISGGTVSGDGSVILILDIPSITQKIRADVDEPEEDFSAIERARKIIAEGSKSSTPKMAAKKKSPIKPAKVSIKKKTVSGRAPIALIVDDSISVRKFVSSVLEKNKYATVLAEDGPEALEELKKVKFDIIITDLEMPKMQGFDLIEEIRKQRSFQSIPIVILTGRAGKKHKDRGVELGANAYITKPFKESDLLNTLETFIKIS